MRRLGIGDFRAYLASREMSARRCRLDQGRQPAYTIAELAGLLDGELAGLEERVMTDEEEAAITQRLEDLGYL